MQADHLGHGSRGAIAEVAVHRVTHHGPQFIERVTLCNDGVSESRGHESTIGRVLLNLENDLAHS